MNGLDYFLCVCTATCSVLQYRQIHRQSTFFLKTIEQIPHDFTFVETRFCISFGVLRVACGVHLRLLAQRATRLPSQWILHWWRVSGSTARKPLSRSTHPLTLSTRMDRQQVPIFKSSAESNTTYQFWWCFLNQLHHLTGHLTSTCLKF